MKGRVIGILIIVALLITITALVVVKSSGYWEQPFSTSGLEGKTGFTVHFNFKDGTTENARLLESQNPFEIWNRFAEDNEIVSITYELAAIVSGRGHTTVQIREKAGYNVNVLNEIYISPPEGFDRQTLVEYSGYLYKGQLSTPVTIDTTINADNIWYTIAAVTISSDTLNNYVESNVDQTFTVGDDFLGLAIFLYTEPNVIEIKSDIMTEWITVDLPGATNTGFGLDYLPPYGNLNWDSKIDWPE